MPHRTCLALWIGLALFAADDEGGPTIFRPLDKTVLPAGPLSVVARGPLDAKLLLDGTALRASRPAVAAIGAVVTPSPGRHELRLTFDGGEHTIEFFVGAGAPADWKAFRTHPPGGSCESCHAVADAKWVVKGDSTAESCLACHDQSKFPATHQHGPEVLKQCEMCHRPHGSAEKAHLKYSKETACKLCHG